MMKRISKIMLLLAVMICFILVPPAAYAAKDTDQRVFDQAKLLTDAEIEDLEQQVAKLRKIMNMDVVLVTTDNTGRKSSRNFADDYYDSGGFGHGREYNGALFLIDMDNRELYVSTSGTMIRFLTDGRIEKMMDNAYSYVQQGDYAGTMNQFLKDTEAYYQKGIPGGQYNYDSETGTISRYRSIRWYEALLALAVSGICAGSVCLGVIKSYGMKQERKQALSSAMAYRADAKYKMGLRNDILKDSHVTRSVIPTHHSGSHGSSGRSSGGSSGSRSTTHRSSSGRSHGGGGRKF